ncbi:SKP1-like protein 1 [Quercus lobata]|uniref:Uncharacterized protein n=1 Tax=Quercus lobata TaxID=97700 RepID=A0A7N2LL08_QUELO|nr:SKP1-like protein 1 [Quercus lobata]
MATYGGSSSSDPTRMVTLKTSDGEEIKVPVAIAMKFVPVREFFMGDLDRPEVENAAPFPLSNVDSLTLAEIVFFNQRSLYFHSKLKEIVEEEPLWELLLKYWPVEKKMQEFKAWFFGRQSDETIVKLVKAADFLENKELLDSVMPSFRERFGLEDDKGVHFVYTAEVEAILLRRAASASGGARF